MNIFAKKYTNNKNTENHYIAKKKRMAILEKIEQCYSLKQRKEVFDSVLKIIV